MKNKFLFVFLDIDGTLLDKTYQSNDGTLPGLIETLQKDGFIFSLNSNRSLEDLLPVAQQFSITGPLVGENGVFIYDQQKHEKRFLITEKERENIQEQIRIIKEKTKDYLKKKVGENFVWEDTDTVQMLGNMPSIYDDGTLLVFNNKFREYTLSSHIKRYVGNTWVEDKKLAEEVVAFLKQQLGEDNILVIDYSSTFGNLLVYPQNTSKREAVKFLRNIFSSYTFIAIGDELSDYKMIQDCGNFYTTGNAEKDVKDLAYYVSPHLHAQGVSDILRSIQ